MASATSSYPLILTQGGDDRLVLKSQGTNKYHCTPEPIEGALFRGSCTCNIPTKEAYAAAESAYNALQNEEVTVSDIMEGVRTQLKTLYDLPPGSEVFLCPSGSDAEYIPLLIAKTLSKGRKIVNIVTCDKEVGSGTLDAAGGRYFSDTVPLPDADDKVGEKITGKPVETRFCDRDLVAGWSLLCISRPNSGPCHLYSHTPTNCIRTQSMHNIHKHRLRHALAMLLSLCSTLF
mmetsp:Transcript_47805/g.74602  ORF Transcript_47805/g.74602 Transcript_47805/m.74602 type:complete len:233 (+) Transcript_47805:90-788(+)